ncbi:hypothetical protein FB45DRAFT_1000490 [Roridomyces roridus]|uniref:Uncharacterized protein n=1 Tax=Roridomyces roridus TaxID=1738132 RepID=A0AAD7C997_9AGAR|nr:hypothetical protein FB45DRAFT_1000490 [Roridomyces roridus]
MFKLSCFVAVAIASRVLADCTPTFNDGALYTVTMTEVPTYAWVDSSTLGSLGVNLRTTIPATQWYLSETGLGGYVFSLDADLSSSSCLDAGRNAGRNAKVPGSGKIYQSLGCLDSTGSLGLDEDFVFSCDTCDESGHGGGSKCNIQSSLTGECANAADDELESPSGEDELDQVKTAECLHTVFQQWDVVAVA